MTEHRLTVPQGWRNAESFYGPALDRVRTVVGDPRTLERLSRYYTRASNYAGATFTQWGDDDPTTMTERDLLAVTLLDARVAPSTVRALLQPGEVQDRVRELLSLERLPLEVSLQEVTPEILAAMDELYTTVRALVPPARDRYEVNWATAAKLCARKRPNLFPVRDEVVCRYLGLWPSRYQVDWQVFYAIMSEESIRADLSRLVRRADEADHVDVGDPDQLLRHLDVVLWMHAPHHY